MAVKWLRDKCLFLPDYGHSAAVACAEMPSHSRRPGNIRVRVSFTIEAVWSAILATAGLLVFVFRVTNRPPIQFVKLLHKHDKLTQCCRAFTLALARRSCFAK